MHEQFNHVTINAHKFKFARLGLCAFATMSLTRALGDLETGPYN